jgi:hypothetical protein
MFPSLWPVALPAGKNTFRTVWIKILWMSDWWCSSHTTDIFRTSSPHSTTRHIKLNNTIFRPLTPHTPSRKWWQSYHAPYQPAFPILCRISHVSFRRISFSCLMQFWNRILWYNLPPAWVFVCYFATVCDSFHSWGEWHYIFESSVPRLHTSAWKHLLRKICKSALPQFLSHCAIVWPTESPWRRSVRKICSVAGRCR